MTQIQTKVDTNSSRVPKCHKFDLAVLKKFLKSVPKKSGAAISISTVLLPSQMFIGVIGRRMFMEWHQMNRGFITLAAITRFVPSESQIQLISASRSELIIRAGD